MSSEEDNNDGEQNQEYKKRRIQRACDTCRRKKSAFNCLFRKIECSKLTFRRSVRCMYKLVRRYVAKTEGVCQAMEGRCLIIDARTVPPTISNARMSRQLKYALKTLFQ